VAKLTLNKIERDTLFKKLARCRVTERVESGAFDRYAVVSSVTNSDLSRSMPLSDKRASWSLLVQDNTQEGFVDVDLAVVSDEALSPEFVHEKIYPRASCANHFRQHLLRYFGNHLLGPVLRTIARQQQQSTRQPFLAGVEQLVHQVLFDAVVSSQCVRYEAVGELVFLVEHANHLVSLNAEHGGEGNRGRRSHANTLARKAPFPEKIAWSQYRYDGFFAGLVDHRKLHTAILNVHDLRCGIALHEDRFLSLKLGYLSP
jgi:hypothetical protein